MQLGANFELNKSETALVDFRKVLSQIGIANRAKLIKAWLNGWATSHRMHEP